MSEGTVDSTSPYVPGGSQGEIFGDDPTSYSFSGHQTFPFRYSWLPKATSALKRTPEIFSEKQALVELGVGKNMVESMRFWCEALGLAEITGQVTAGKLTPFGKLLFGAHERSNGKDPYLEDPGTLWLLHWVLASTTEKASTWYLAFTKWNRSLFTREQLAKWVLQIAESGGNKKISPNSIKRDVDVFLRTYVPVGEDGRRPIEDSFDCPLGELGLIRELDDGFFQFRVGPKPSLPVGIFAHALEEFWERSVGNQKTLNIERVLFDPGSPGAAFKLNDKGLISLIEKLPRGLGIRFDETAGLRTLVKTGRSRNLEPLDILRSYYDGEI